MRTQTRSIVVPYNGAAPVDAVQAALSQLLGESPGRGFVQVRLVEYVPQPPPPGFGPGTELKALLSRLGITPPPGCKCIARANDMDRRGCEWCAANIDTIVGWLREEAGKRGLPFVDTAGRLLVRRAIANARKRNGT